MKLIDNSIIRLSDIDSRNGGEIFHAISPDGDNLTYFDGQENLIIRDLTKTDFDIIKTYSKPFGNDYPGNLIYSSDGKKLYMSSKNTGEYTIISFDLQNGTIENLLSAGGPRQKMFKLSDEDKLYYKENNNIVEFDVNSKTKKALFGLSAPIGFYLENKLYSIMDARTSDNNILKNVFYISIYDSTTGNILSEVKAEHNNAIGPGQFIGFGKTEKELIFSEYSGEQDGNVFYSYNTDNQIFNKIITAFSETPSYIITVISPNGGEKFEAGKTYKITWSTSNLPNSSDFTVRADLLFGNLETGLSEDVSGLLWFGQPIKPKASDDYINWTVPSNLSGNYIIFLALIDNTHSEGRIVARDFSDASFIITLPTIAP